MVRFTDLLLQLLNLDPWEAGWDILFYDLIFCIPALGVLFGGRHTGENKCQEGDAFKDI